MTSGSYLPPKKTKSEKFVREVKRLGRQLSFYVLPTWGHLTRINYDRRRATDVRTTEGMKSLEDEVMILLIYQPKGLLDSTMWQIEWMAAKGIATIVISNLPLSDADRTRLQAISYLVVERPNVGYDFGGYREGILQLVDRGIRPKTLYVLNDSMWFPLTEDSDVIERCRAAPEDLWGLFVDLDWRHRLTGNLDGKHIQSYFFRFSEHVLQDQRFWDYWLKMSVISSKRVVINVRELKLAPHFADMGFSVGGLHSWQEVVDYLLALDDEDKMAAILEHQPQVRKGDAIIIEPYLQKQGLSALQIRDELRDQIADTHIFLHSTAIHPFLMMDLGFPFLKKTRISIMIAKRRKLVELGLHNTFHETVRREVETWDKN